jgi:peptide deformylase
MALLKIARMGHPVLLRQAEAVPNPCLPDLRKLVQDMADTMLDANGIGLAAPQVYLPVRLFIWRNGADVSALFNPELVPLDDEIETAWEGCLSIPGLRGAVPPARRISFRGLNQHGEPVAGEAEGLAARVMQHETDHLNGLLYPMRMTDFTRFGFTEELNQAKDAAR